MHKFSTLGLVLMAASITIAAVMPKAKTATPGNRIADSTDNGCSNQKTCVPASGFNECTVTIGTQTTALEGTSSYTSEGYNKTYISGNGTIEGKNSSVSPC